jgi:hypothetical protein
MFEGDLGAVWRPAAVVVAKASRGDLAQSGAVDVDDEQRRRLGAAMVRRIDAAEEDLLAVG